MFKRGVVAAVVVAVAAVALVSVFGVFSSTSRSAARGDGRTVGIVVHGAWTIEVRGANGKLAARRTFENALVPAGAGALASILGRASQTGMWQLSLLPAGVCDTFFLCNIREAGSSAAPPVITAKTLTVTAPTTGPDAGKVVLTGTLTATRAGTIDEVRSFLFLPPPTGGLGAETGARPQFTGALLPAPIAVQPDQQVSVTVRFSFS